MRLQYLRKRDAVSGPVLIKSRLPRTQAAAVQRHCSPRGPIQPYFGCGGESAITSPGPGVVKWLIALSSPSLLPSLPIEVTL